MGTLKSTRKLFIAFKVPKRVLKINKNAAWRNCGVSSGLVDLDVCTKRTLYVNTCVALCISAESSKYLCMSQDNGSTWHERFYGFYCCCLKPLAFWLFQQFIRISLECLLPLERAKKIIKIIELLNKWTGHEIKLLERRKFVEFFL